MLCETDINYKPKGVVFQAVCRGQHFGLRVLFFIMRLLHLLN